MEKKNKNIGQIYAKMNSPTASDKIYSIFFKYEDENSVEENCWEVAKSSKEKNARNYFLKNKLYIQELPQSYLSMGYNKIELVKTEEMFTFCSLFRREILIDCYSSNLYIESKSEEEQAMRVQPGSPSFKIKPGYLGPLVKIQSKPSGLFKPHPPNKQQDLDGNEYFNVVDPQYHNIEF